MGNPTKELLAKLDELGVEYDTYDLPNGEHGVSWIDGNDIEWEAVQLGENFEIHALQLVTPEQAIAATVGADSNTGEAVRELLDKLNTELCNAGCVIECETREERKRLIDAVKDKYVHVIAATVGKDIEHYDGSGRRGTVAILQGGRKPEEVMFVGEDGGVTHYLPEGTCDGSFHKSSDISSGRVPLYYCKDTNRSIFVEREAKVCPLCGGRVKEESK